MPFFISNRRSEPHTCHSFTVIIRADHRIQSFPVEPCFHCYFSVCQYFCRSFFIHTFALLNHFDRFLRNDIRIRLIFVFTLITDLSVLQYKFCNLISGLIKHDRSTFFAKHHPRRRKDSTCSDSQCDPDNSLFIHPSASSCPQ